LIFIMVSMNGLYRRGILAIVAILVCSSLYAGEAIKVVFERPGDGFELVHKGKVAPLLVDRQDAEVVRIAAQAFIKDVKLVCGAEPELLKVQERPKGDYVVIGTLGRNRLIDSFVKKGVISVEEIRGQWEMFKIAVVKLSDEQKALVIAGSDRRGTAFGVFEVSKMMGVSPWVWWADVRPRRREALYIQNGTPIVQGPSVKYRGIFLNDEDWGLKPWAAKNIDSDVQDIGPKTYALIFELMLRLKANYIWPAMHECTKAFYYYKENPKVAERYGIVVGSSHCEPMLRNNVDEWTHNFKNEYEEKRGPWRYDTNKKQIYQYWEDRAKESASYESIYTVGMRGIHDSGMPGPSGTKEKIELLEKIFADQQEILKKTLGKKISEIPQSFCPYKEVLELYVNGLSVPEDVTILWVDDNHGYIRQLPNPEEQKRAGGHGVYYHISYHGAPHSYLWLSTISPAMISFEMSRAYQFGAREIWVVNVGDIKPQELEAEFFLDLAWDVNAWPPEKAYLYSKEWGGRVFGDEFAEDFAEIKKEYYRLAHRAKPEHVYLAKAEITLELAEQRAAEYRRLAEKVKELEKQIPAELKDAYFQILLYPVLCASKIEEKIAYARKSIELAERGDEEALEYAKKAKERHDEIQELTRNYNENISGGKWDGMMMKSSYPNAGWLRRLAGEQPLIYEMPKVADHKMLAEQKGSGIDQSEPNSQMTVPAKSFVKHKDTSKAKVQIVENLGISGASVITMPFTTPSILESEIIDGPYVEYQVNIPKGTRTVEVKCMPTFGVYKGHGVRYAVSVNGDTPQVIDINAARWADEKNRNVDWATNVVRGYASGKTTHTVDKDGQSTIRVYLLEPGLAVSEIEIW